MCGLVPKTFSMVPKMCGIMPKMCGMVPKMCGMVPKMCGTVPKMCGKVPQMCGIKGYQEHVYVLLSAESGHWQEVTLGLARAASLSGSGDLRGRGD